MSFTLTPTCMILARRAVLLVWWFVSIGGFGAERSNPVLEKNIRQDSYLEDLFWTIMITRELSWSLEDLGFTSGPVALAPTSCAAAPILTLLCRSYVCAHQRQASANEQEVTICLVMSSSHFPQQPCAENEKKNFIIQNFTQTPI